MKPLLDSAPGRQRGWTILEKIGEGDAGEVFRVESLLDHKPAILKRPQRKGFPSDIIRQATQIEKEAAILSILSSVDSPARLMHVPALLDQSQPGTEYTDRYFIVITQAAGFSLDHLTRFIRYSNEIIAPEIHSSDENASKTQKLFVKELREAGTLPELLALRTIVDLIEFLEMIHSITYSHGSDTIHGIIWNDIKLDHIYWDPETLSFTLIDWGNAQYLDADGISKDRQFSKTNDYAQFIGVFDEFLANDLPGLRDKLNFPSDVPTSRIYSEGILPLKERANHLLQVEMENRRIIRNEEAALLENQSPHDAQISRLEEIQKQILRMGEIPDFRASEAFLKKILRLLILDSDWEKLISLQRRFDEIPYLDTIQLNLLVDLTKYATEGKISTNTVIYGLEDDWISVLWDLRSASLNTPDTSWWENAVNQIRLIEIGPNNLRPLVALNRLIHALQSVKSNQENPADYDQVIAEIKDGTIKRWLQLEPDPPFSGIEYADIQNPLLAAAEFMPDGVNSVRQSLDQSESHIRLALDAWERKDFNAAQKSLRRALFWDPDRLRFIQADRAIQLTETWLESIRSGLINDEPLQDFITRMELTGREIRNQVAGSEWLDDLLEALKELRKGSDPTEVLVQHPKSRVYLDWLITLEPRRPLLSSPGKKLTAERADVVPSPRPAFTGVQEAPLGSKTGITLQGPLDTWVPEARGSSARLFDGTIPNSQQRLAFKIMRPDRTEYAQPLFKEETQILMFLSNVRGVIPLYECGYIMLDSTQTLPPEDPNEDASGLKGTAIRYGLDSVHNFLADLDSRTEQGWLPYLALLKFDRQDNLLLHCDTGYTNGRFLPTLDGLIMAMQICDILEAAHSRNIVYRDHKILHYYWQEINNGIFMIDWNVAKRHASGLSATDTQFDLVQFGARCLHYILTGRAAPGALPLGPNKPEEIEAAATTYSVNWTYDDQRLPKDIKDILESVLKGEYLHARDLREDLNRIFQNLSELFQPKEDL